MNNQMDKLLKMTLQSQVEPEKALEQKTIQRMEAMSDNKRRNVKKVKRRVRHSFRPVLAGLGVLLLVGIITGGYAVADETNIARVLYAGIWGEPETQKEVKRVRSEMEIVSENSTFEDISIKPVEAVTDGMVSYVLIKVEGKNGFELADDMGFDRMGMALLDEKKKNVMTYDSYLLKKEKNVMYIAIYMQANGRNISEMESIKIFAHDFHYVVYGEEGRVEDVKHLDVEKHLDGGSRVGYTEKSIAARGDYEAEIKCSILEERLEI